MLKQKIISTLLVLISGLSLSHATQIASSDLHLLPEGETMTLTGTDLGDATAARMIPAGGGSQFPTTVNALSDTTLEVVMPDVSQESGGYHLLVETSSGSTIGIPEGYTEHTSVGSVVSSPFGTSSTEVLVVRAGAVLTGEHFYSTVIVEAGGVFEVPDGSLLRTIIAEDGAVIDFTDLALQGQINFLHSPDTVIIGAVPIGFGGASIGEELTSITASYGLDTFSVGYSVNLSIVGDGIVTKNPEQTYYAYGEEVELTATAGDSSTFSGWSGEVTSASNTITVQPDDMSGAVIATFSAGWLLDIYDIAGVSVSVVPDSGVYADGQTVTLTASLASGYTFEGWGIGASGSDLITSLSMDSNKRVIPIVRKDGYDELPQVTGSDLHQLPESETMTLTGTDLGDATAARMIWAASGSQFPTTVNALSDTTLEVFMPDVSQESRDYHLLVETSSGSTIGIPEGYTEHTSIGPAASSPFGTSITEFLVVRAGAVLTGEHYFTAVFVETGGVFEVSGGSNLKTVVAEDGAVVDFTDVASQGQIDFLHSPDTVIIGAVPIGFGGASIGEELTSITASYGLDTFSVGYSVNLSIVGDGIVTKNPEQTYYAYGEEVELTATAGDSSTFSGWSGEVTSASNTITVQPDDMSGAVIATFSAGWLLDIYDIAGVSVSVVPDSGVYADGQTVTLTASLASGYTFEGWGIGASGSDLITSLSMDSNKRVIPIVRKDGYDELPQVTGSDLHQLPEGETMTLTGTDLDDATAARMIRAASGSQFPATVNALSDTTLEVVMPDVSQESRDYHLLVETSSGSTIGIPGGYDEHTSIGGVRLGGGFGVSGDGVIVVRAGALLSGEHFYSTVIVEAGGVFEVSDGSRLKTVIAENGAVVDFTGVASQGEIDLLHSPDTVIIGTVPIGFGGAPIGEELTSIRASYGLGTFTIAYLLSITIEGPGSVMVDPIKDYYTPDDTIEVTATEDAGAFFIRWVGEVSGSDNTANLSISENTTLIARFSTAPDYFSSWRLEHFTIEELGDIGVSAFDADPDGDSITNAAEYAFGTDPRIFDEGFGPQLDLERTEPGEIRFYASYTRPKDALDVNYRILLSQDMATWNHNDDDTDVTYSKEVSVESIDDDNEKVTVLLYPNTDAPSSVFIQVSAALFE
ncbi:MAG: InlB B-repeat-containing protein [Opitutaceae bacterium]